MKNEKGQASLVEFCLMFMVFLIILIFIFGAVFVIHNYLVLDRAIASAAREGAVGATEAEMIERINAEARQSLINTPILAGRCYDDQIRIEIYDTNEKLILSGGRNDYNDVYAENRIKITLFYEVYFALPYFSELVRTRIPISETICLEQPEGGWYPH
ncbi:MAG: TadE/TadG family type IV pilus assembly protein [bacterium]